MKRFVRNLASNSNMQIAVGLMWSFSAVLVKDLTATQHLDIFLIASIRSFIGIFFLLPLVLVHWSIDNAAPVQADVMSPVKTGENGSPVLCIKLLGASALATNSFLLCWAFQHTDALTPVFMHYSGLLLVAPASVFLLSYSPSRREWLASGLASVGLMALVAHGLSFQKWSVVAVSIGVGLTQLVGQLCIAWLSKNDSRVERKTGKKQSHAGQCFIICEVLTILVGISISATTTSSLSLIDWRSSLELLALGVLTWGIPNFLCLLAVRTKELVSLSLLWLGDPIGVALWPVLCGQDPLPTLLSCSGATMVLLALGIQRSGQKK
jgi:hypothetical protein